MPTNPAPASPPKRLLIQHADWLVTMDPSRRIVTDGAVAIEGSRIVAVGKTEEIAASFQADKVIDATGKLVMPGLIDTHVHNSQQLGRGLCDGCDLPVHLFERLYGYEQQLTEEDAYWAAINCQLEMIRAGTTCFVDPGNYFPDQMARAIGESGMRGVIARIAFDVHSTVMGDLPSHLRRETATQALDHAEAAVRRLNGLHDGRVRTWFALRVLAVCSDEIIRGAKSRADALGVGLALHASESRDEVVAARVKFGMHDLERMEMLGALGPNVLVIHFGWANPKEIALCVKHDIKVSCSPSAGYRLGLGSMEFGRFPEMLELGVSVSLGSDSAMSSNFVDVVRQMNHAAGGAKSQSLNPSVMPPETVFEMATLHGANSALWSDEIGSLEPGKRADIAMFDTRKPEWQPVLNPIANLVYAARGGADTVICNGQVLMEDGVVLTIDEERALLESKTRGNRIARESGIGARIMPKWPIE
jgi:5-methylthioadenosine/S-adenosylhomocysteine deaminase